MQVLQIHQLVSYILRTAKKGQQDRDEEEKSTGEVEKKQ